MENTPKSVPESKTDRLTARLSQQRTTLAFQRTRLSADRTLMSMIRTALTLIGFGFTIFQFFRSLKDIKGIRHAPLVMTGQIGLWLVGMGIFMLFLGIIYHVIFMLMVRKEYDTLHQESLFIKPGAFPFSTPLLIAILLLLLGIYVIFKMFLLHTNEIGNHP